MTLVIPEPATVERTEPSTEPLSPERVATGQRPKTCPSCGARFPADALFCSLDGSPLTSSPAAIAAAAATDPYLGREILGHIEIRQLVGIGAMGRVYRAFQRGIDRDVAVKVLHRELSSNATLVARFDREAKVASRLAHPNVVHVLLVGQLPDGAMYIVMEYLDGLSLQSALAGADGAMPLPRALHIALQLCDAAGEGHAQGIVHRDLKPENVMLVRRADDPDFVKVLDFGIARVHWGEQSMATAAGLIFGTARYISPEGAQGEQVGPAGDVYSIATMVYQMLSGRTPFNADQAVAVLVQQIHDPPPPLQTIARSAYVPEPIASVVMQNLSKKAAERAPDGRAFGRALLEAAVTSGLSAQDVLARPSLLGGPRGSPPSAVQLPSMQRTRQLQLDSETSTRMGRSPSSTAFETPSPGLAEGSNANRATTHTEVADPFALPPGMATTKWSSPSAAPPVVPGPSHGVDETIDDQQMMSPRSHTMPLRAAPSPHVALGAGDAPSPESRTSPVPVPATPAAPGARPARMDVQGAAPIVSLASLPGARARAALAWRPMLVVGLVVAVFGIFGARWRGGMLGGPGPQAPPEAVAARGGPPAVNVTPELGANYESPSLQRVPPLDLSTPARSKAGVPASNASAPLGAPSGSSAAASSGRFVIEASNGRPGVGQPVDFEARFSSGPAGRPTKVDGARFEIAGPGIASGTELPAADDGSGVFRTTFTFLESGRFEVAFAGRTSDRSQVRAARVVVVSDRNPNPPADAPNGPPTNATATGSATAKWL